MIHEALHWDKAAERFWNDITSDQVDQTKVGDSKLVLSILNLIRQQLKFNDPLEWTEESLGKIFACLARCKEVSVEDFSLFCGYFGPFGQIVANVGQLKDWFHGHLANSEMKSRLSSPEKILVRCSDSHPRLVISDSKIHHRIQWDPLTQMCSIPVANVKARNINGLIIEMVQKNYHFVAPNPPAKTIKTLYYNFD